MDGLWWGGSFWEGTAYGILLHELITWKPQDYEIVCICFFDFLVQFLETFELGCETAF